MIKIIDNIVSKKQQNIIKKYVFSNYFPWYYINDVSILDNPDERKPGLSHYFILNNKVSSDGFKTIECLISATLNKLKIEKAAVIQCRAFLQFPLSENIIKGRYVDSPHIDLLEKHTAFLYYVNDSDGDTVIFEDAKKNKIKKKIKPKQGRMVIFDGSYWHSGSQPRHSNRCVINTDVRI
jgi:hypothetical protein